MDTANNESDSESYLTVAELAQKARVAEVTIYRWIRGNRITYFQHGGKGGHYRFPPDALEQCMRLNVINQPLELLKPVKPVKKRLPGRQPGWKSKLAHPSCKSESVHG